ncbi:RNA polymerase I-specific transcription initiation factor RRN3 [Hyaloraphidium curvatum]|nr:RNA polymerase I-specific transcription initiation factor RRN3 [Hyaloraphidium curvatum]
MQSRRGAPATLRPAPRAMGDVEVATLGFLKKALRDLARGDRNGYAAMLDELRETAGQLASLLSWLRAFAEVVSLLDKTFHEVVEFWLSIDWTGQDEEFAALYQQFLESLVSAQAFYGQAVARMVIKAFGSGEQQWTPGSQTDRRLHHLLKRVLELVPTAPSFVASLLAEHFPHPRAPLNCHIHYLRHAIKVLDYAPNFEKQLLSLIVDRILQIDVHVQKDEVEAVTPTEPQTDTLVFDMDAGEAVMDSDAEEDPADDELDSDTEGTANDTVDQSEMALKLDALMVIVFDYLSATFRNLKSKPDKAAVRRAKELHSVLLNIFDRTISRSVRSRHVQFLIFYTSSFSEEFSDDFLTLLIERITDPSLPALNRMSAAGYAGSFVARAKYLSMDRVKECLGVMAEWAASYVRKFESSAVSPDHRKYGVFYAVVQAVLYVFVFRWRELMRTEGDGAARVHWPPELHAIPGILNSRFKPLKVVSSGVAHEFASTVHRLELHYVNSMIDRRDAKVSGPLHWPDAIMADSSGSLVAETDISYWAILNGFFPFDPYQLPKSGSYVEDLYLEWQDGSEAAGHASAIGFRPESDSSEDDDLGKLLSVSMSVSL